MDDLFRTWFAAGLALGVISVSITRGIVATASRLIKFMDS